MSKPIFVLGSPRSGTSIITKAIKDGVNVKGYAEGHFLPIIKPLMQAIADFYQKNEKIIGKKSRTISHIERNELEEEITKTIRKIHDQVIKHEVWIDKTPGFSMIEAAPYLLKTWPESRFIFAKRRGIECVISRLKKFPNVPFETHCKLWTQAMESWLKVRDSLTGYYLEIEQRDIGLNPQVVAKAIGELLNIEPEKVKKIEDIFINERMEDTGGKETTQAIKITETGWTDEEIKIFRKHCGKISQKFGYSETSDYFLLTKK